LKEAVRPASDVGSLVNSEEFSLEKDFDFLLIKRDLAR